MRKITVDQANAIYDILVREAGANDNPHNRERDAFVYHVAVNKNPAFEYRFGGFLGWGGKFRNNGNYDNIPHVDCYREHLNSEREEIITKTNEAIKALFV